MGSVPKPRPKPEKRLPWVLLANGARARLFERDPDNDALREIAAFVHPAARAKAGALGHDRPGQVTKGRGETQLAPATSRKPRSPGVCRNGRWWPPIRSSAACWANSATRPRRT
jgi:hypothetical protein